MCSYFQNQLVTYTPFLKPTGYICSILNSKLVSCAYGLNPKLVSCAHGLNPKLVMYALILYINQITAAVNHEFKKMSSTILSEFSTWILLGRTQEFFLWEDYFFFFPGRGSEPVRCLKIPLETIHFTNLRGGLSPHSPTPPLCSP